MMAFELCGLGFAETMGCVVLISLVFFKSVVVICILVAVAVFAALKYD